MKRIYLLLLCVSFLVNNAFAQEKEQESEMVYKAVEQMPYLKSCQDNNNKEKCTLESIMEHIMYSVKYPSICVEGNIQGKVFVYYEIGKDGKVQNVKIAKGVHAALDREAIRVVERLPDFIPGFQDGKKVVTMFSIPINFRLTK